MRAKTLFKKGHANPDTRQVKEWFGGLPIVEAKAALRIQPSAADLASSVRNDAQRCVFSQCAKRMWGASKVLFFGSIAYVDLLDDRGHRRVERFRISTAGREMIKAFDAGKKVKLAGFILRPPSSQMSREARRKYMRKYHAKHGYARVDSGKNRKSRPASHVRFVEFERQSARAQKEARA